MAEFDMNQLTPEMIQKAAMCENVDELMALAGENGIDITREEAEAFLEETEDIELDEETLQSLAGGTKTCYVVDGCAFKCGSMKDC